MDFIKGYVLVKKKCEKPQNKSISEMFIGDFNEMVLEGEHLLTNAEGKIVSFTCEEGGRRFKGVVKFKIGNKKLEFSLRPQEGSRSKDMKSKDISIKEDVSKDISINENMNEQSNENISILIENKKYSINSTPSILPTTRVYFGVNQLICETSEDCVISCLSNPFEIVKINLKSASLHNFILSNLPVDCSPHSSLSYFCISNLDTFYGFTFSYHKEGHHFYSVVLLSDFYNPLGLFNVDVNRIGRTPLFKNNCFLLCEGSEEIYLSSRVCLTFNFSQDLLDKAIASILCEERVYFVSKKDVFLKVMYFLQYIEPFKWSHSLLVCNTGDLGGVTDTPSLLNSPLPFIVGVKHTPPSSHCVLIDLDLQTVENYSLRIKASKDYSLRLANYLDSKKKFILQLNVSNIQNVLMYSYRYFREGIISIFPEDLEYSYEFMKKFTSTRMFIRHISEERVESIDFIFDIRSKRLEVIPFSNILDYTAEEVINVYSMIYDLENTKLTDKLKRGGVREGIVRRLCVNEEYDSLSTLFKEKEMTLRESLKINVYEKQGRFKIEKEDFEGMKFVNVCEKGGMKCVNVCEREGGMKFVNMCEKEREGRGLFHKHNTNKHFKSKTINTHESCSHKEKCKFKTLILRGGKVYTLYPLPSLTAIFFSLPETNLKEEFPEIFYNLVGYFFYFDLPFNCEEVDYVLE